MWKSKKKFYHIKETHLAPTDPKRPIPVSMEKDFKHKMFHISLIILKVKMNWNSTTLNMKEDSLPLGDTQRPTLGCMEILSN